MENLTTIVIDTATKASTWADQVSFSWYDYILFCGMLMVSLLIGIYFGCFGSKQSTANEYLLGGRTMKVLPISMSLIASNVSGISLLAVPADIYQFGATYGLCCIAITVVCIITCYIYLPVFYNLEITSAYEYMKLRFNTRVRLLSSFLFALAVILNMPIVIYIPALAFAKATGINIHYITPLVCGVCIFYTTIGGLKAVVWTDTLQFTITVGAMIAVFVLGIDSAGGLKAVFEKAWDGERLDIDFDLNPTKRDTFWALAIGFTVHYIPHLSIHQGCVQKFLSLPTYNDAKLSVIIFGIGFVIVKLVCVVQGLIMYAKYYNCDPLSVGKVKESDELLPYYVMDIVGHIPGLPGLFIAGVFCTALSSLSAGLNCLAGSIYEDFVSRYMPKCATQKTISNVLKLLVVIIGVIATILVYMVEKLGGLLPLAISLSSVACGPLLGLFTFGILFPKANSKGAFYGAVVALLFLFWIIMGAQYYKAKGFFKYASKPLSTAGCNFEFTPKNSTFLHQPPEVLYIYKISYYYYSLIGASTCILVGYPISLLTRNADDPPVHKSLLCPLVHFMVVEKNDKKDKYYTINKALRVVESNKNSV